MAGNETEETMDYKLLLDTAVLAGKLMLASGAEIYRVEDTVERILATSGLKTREAYVTSTGFIVTLDDPKFDSMTVVRRVPSRVIDLNVITIVNTISREFCAGEIDLKTAFHRLKHMDARQYRSWQKELATIGVVTMFTVVFGGSVQDLCAAAAVGGLLVLMERLGRRFSLNAFLQTMLSAAVIAIGAICISSIKPLQVNMDTVIISAIMPIVPGAALTTAIRDILQGDYVSGGAKALEALVKAAAIVLGVGAGMMAMGGLHLWT
ncbi:MAG: threonine/serine exporter family protein [Eubacteriales bacterium]|nr:threonine/serine exporter family protein [Eubacteriales bacterium]